MNAKTLIRDHHNQFSRLFIEKYADLFEIPSKEHLRAVAVIAMGHRKTDLLNGEEYPVSLSVPGGARICLPYLSAVVRLADEIDVASDRNSALIYSEKEVASLMEFSKHQAVQALKITKDAFILMVDTSDEALLRQIEIMTEKMQDTLEGCRRAVNGRTPYTITQERVLIQRIRP